MSKFEVWVTAWSEEYGRQVKVIAGEFSRYMDAKLFADAYSKFYSATTDIEERMVK